MTASRVLPSVVVAVSVAALGGCGAAKSEGRDDAPAAASSTLRGSSPRQALRTCVDRWNRGNMLGWGPTLVNVSIRRLTADQLAAVGLRNPALRRCAVSLAVHSRRDPTSGCSGEAVMPGYPRFCVYRKSTYVCIINRFGGYGCPTNAEGSPPLRNANATTNERGVLKLDVPLKGTHATRPLAWQRLYPHTDGWVEPWTKRGTLRAGVKFTFDYRDGGTCSQGSQQTRSRIAVRCLWLTPTRMNIVDPCFPQTPRWHHRGAVVACPSMPGSTNLGRFVIAKPR